jgi:hypothetical protein
MDSEIKALVYKCLNGYKNKNIGNVDSDELIKLVLPYKSRFDPNRGSFNGFFGTITKNYMMLLYRKDEARIKLVMARNEKINQILND